MFHSARKATRKAATRVNGQTSRPAVEKPSVDQAERNRENIALAQQAAADEVTARKKVNELIHPVIQYQTNRFCKRFCKENRVRFRCTLNPPITSVTTDCSLCEWGNGSYAWMLDDLSNSNRLQKYQANNNATLFDYCYVIANSLPFYERWKDWRFGRKIHVPSYIRELGKPAVSVFYGLRSRHTLQQIAQSAKMDIEAVRELSRQIVQILTKKNRLHLLNPVQTISMDQETGDEQVNTSLESETASHDESFSKREEKSRLAVAWKHLTVVEQFVIEALVIEEQDAEVVLNALRKLGLSIRDGVSPENIDRQQLYYFRRKTLAKLNELLG